MARGELQYLVLHEDIRGEIQPLRIVYTSVRGYEMDLRDVM